MRASTALLLIALHAAGCFVVGVLVGALADRARLMDAVVVDGTGRTTACTEPAGGWMDVMGVAP